MSSILDFAFIYPIKGLYFFLLRENRTILWQRVAKFAIQVTIVSSTILGTIVGLTFHAQRDILLQILPEFLDQSLGTFALILIETTLPVTLLFFNRHQTIQEKLFEDVLQLKQIQVERASIGELEWIHEQTEIQNGWQAQPSRRESIIRNVPSILIDPETLNNYPKLKYFLTLPLNCIPIIGQILFCWLNAMEIATILHHHYYANMKGLSFEEEATMIHFRKAQYIQFGLVASTLTLLPGINVMLVLTNAIGAALWAVDIEKALQQHHE